jgi:hypothetical protein
VIINSCDSLTYNCLFYSISFLNMCKGFYLLVVIGLNILGTFYCDQLRNVSSEIRADTSFKIYYEENYLYVQEFQQKALLLISNISNKWCQDIVNEQGTCLIYFEVNLISLKIFGTIYFRHKVYRNLFKRLAKIISS